MTKYENSRGQAAAILQIISGHNSAADCLTSVKYRVESSFSQNSGSGATTRVPQNVLLVFLKHSGLNRSGQIVKSEKGERFPSLPHSPSLLFPFSLPLPSPPSPPYLPSLPLEVGPLNPARGSGEFGAF